MKYCNIQSVTFVFIGLLLGMLLSVLISPFNNDSSKTTDANSLAIQVREDEDVCPVKGSIGEGNARVTFLPVPIHSTGTNQHPDLNTSFNLTEFRSKLYREGNLEHHYPVEEVLIDGGKELQVYYGDLAVNHLPHIAYVVEDGTTIFVTEGANVRIEGAFLNGIQVVETLDWNKGKYKRTMFEYIDGNFFPRWYQISCDVNND